MLDILGLPEYTTDWQHLVCLLYALDRMGGAGGHRRREVCEFIQREGLLTLGPEDIRPYPTQSEPSWQTDIAFARKIGVIMGIVGYAEHDSWECVRDGREQLQRILAAGAQRTVDVRQCYLWSRYFRRVFDTSYEPSIADRARPPRRIHGVEDPADLQRARALVASGKAEDTAARLTAELGFRVQPDVRSLALAFEIRMSRLLESL